MVNTKINILNIENLAEKTINENSVFPNVLKDMKNSRQLSGTEVEQLSIQFACACGEELSDKVSDNIKIINESQKTDVEKNNEIVNVLVNGFKFFLKVIKDNDLTEGAPIRGLQYFSNALLVKSPILESNDEADKQKRIKKSYLVEVLTQLDRDGIKKHDDEFMLILISVLFPESQKDKRYYMPNTNLEFIESQIELLDEESLVKYAFNKDYLKSDEFLLQFCSRFRKEGRDFVELFMSKCLDSSLKSIKENIDQIEKNILNEPLDVKEEKKIKVVMDSFNSLNNIKDTIKYIHNDKDIYSVFIDRLNKENPSLCNNDTKKLKNTVLRSLIVAFDMNINETLLSTNIITIIQEVVKNTSREISNVEKVNNKLDNISRKNQSDINISKRLSQDI